MRFAEIAGCDCGRGVVCWKHDVYMREMMGDGRLEMGVVGKRGTGGDGREFSLCF